MQFQAVAYGVTLNRTPTQRKSHQRQFNQTFVLTNFFLLNHLCKTQNGIPLTPLARQISKNFSNKGRDEFENELLLISKTPQQIKKWFQFCSYSGNYASRTLINSKTHKGIDQSTPLVMRSLQLTEAIPHGNSIKRSSQKMKILMIDVDQLLRNQPYLSQSLEETSHFLYWDISEGDVG